MVRMRADARANREDLLQAARDLTGEKGLDVSLRAIAQRAGVGVATLYRHFPTRRDLLTELLQGLLADPRAAAERFHSGEEDLSARWRDFAVHVAAVNLTAVAVTRQSMKERDLPHRELMEAAEGEILELMESVASVVRAARIVRADVTGERFLLGLMTVMRPLLPEVEQVLPGQRAWLLDAYLRGLAAG